MNAFWREPFASPLKPKDGLNGAPGTQHLRIEMWGTQVFRPCRLRMTR